MELWNKTIEAAPRTADQDVPFICKKILQQVGYKIPERVWIPHLLNLWESKQLGRDDMLILMKEYHEQKTLVDAMGRLTTQEDD